MSSILVVLVALLGLGSAQFNADVIGGAAPIRCAINRTATQPYLTCPSGSSCCKSRFWGTNICATDSTCNVCAECCHDELKNNATACAACVRTCAPGSYGESGCSSSSSNGGHCCPPGQVLFGNPALPNCLLVGDSVAHGTFPLVREMMNTTCNVYNIESVASDAENSCFFSTSTSAATGLPMQWHAVHYNEGLHSLYPRVNTSAELAQWSYGLGNFTVTLQKTGAHLVYATMTPFMPEKYLNPDIPGPSNPRNDVETKNAVAVKTVQALGVKQIDDLYSAITDICGAVYKNCSLCDNESQYHPEGECGYHYSPAGWEILAKQTAKYFTAALATTTSA